MQGADRMVLRARFEALHRFHVVARELVEVVDHRCGRAAQRAGGIGHHRDAQFVQPADRQAWRDAGAVEVQWSPDLAGAALQFRLRGERFREDHVCAGIQVGIGTPDQFLDAAADDATRVAAGDQHEVGVEFAPHLVAGAQLADHLLHRYHLLAGDMSAALGRDLVFDVDRSGTGADEVFHGPHRVDRVAEAGIRIGDDRDRHGACDVAGDHHDLVEREQADVGLAEQRG